MAGNTGSSGNVPSPDGGSWATSAASWAWEHSSDIASKLADLYRWFKGSVRADGGLLIVGPGGVGKTTLGKILSGEYDYFLDMPGAYQESLAVERYPLADKPNVEIVVPPGQEHRREATWAGLHANISAGKFGGVIFLGAYGYETLGLTSYRMHALYQAFPGKEKFVPVYLHERRDAELRLLQELSPHLAANQSKLWMLSLVSKEDLWKPVQNDVHEYYRNGAYASEIGKLRDRLGPRFQHEYVFGSLAISNFGTSSGEVLQPNAQGYDQGMQVKSLRRLFETVDALRNWGAAR